MPEENYSFSNPRAAIAHVAAMRKFVDLATGAVENDDPILYLAAMGGLLELNNTSEPTGSLMLQTMLDQAALLSMLILTMSPEGVAAARSEQSMYVDKIMNELNREMAIAAGMKAGVSEETMNGYLDEVRATGDAGPLIERLMKHPHA